MGIPAPASPRHEYKPKSHEYRLRIHLRLRLRHHGLVLICHPTVHAYDGLFIYIVPSTHTRALVSRMLIACSLSTYIYILYVRA
jgi:hypothetical protein